MDFTTIILVLLGVSAAIAIGVFSWRFENVSNVNEEEKTNSEEKTYSEEKTE